MRLRGLKLSTLSYMLVPLFVEAYAASWIEILGVSWESKVALCRSLCGFVDWNLKPAHSAAYFVVEAYAASWIEISLISSFKLPGSRRSLCGFVDWNYRIFFFVISPQVEAYAASWIEIILRGISRYNFKVEAYAASWIEINMIKASGARRSLSNLMQFHGLN